MPTPFPRLIEGRSGERLLQGLLKYALEKDTVFLRAFCQWLGFRGEPDGLIKEELVKEDGGRPDLTINFGKNNRKTIELKIYAGPTDRQGLNKEEQYSDRLIVPENRIETYLQYYDEEDIRSWENFEKEFSSCATVDVLFSGLQDFIDLVQELDIEKVKGEFFERLEQKDGNWKTWGLLRELSGKVKSSGIPLDTGAIKGSQSYKVYWYGMYIGHKEDKINPYRLWIGFLFSPGFKGPYSDEPHLVLQWPEGLKNCPEKHLKDYYKASGQKMHDIELVPPEGWNGLFTVDGAWKELEPLLKRYSKTLNDDENQQ